MPFASLFLTLLVLSGHRGTVLTAGVPVPGATITLTKGDQKLVTTTDANGVYTIPDLADGTWTVQVEMLGFAPTKQDITASENAPATEWDLKMLAMEEMHAETAKVPPAAAGSTATAQRPQVVFQRADVRETARPTGVVAAPADAPAPSQSFANLSAEELAQRAADGLLINGSVNNGGSQFGQLPRIGNNVPGQRSLYTGAINAFFDSSRLDAQQYSLTGQQTPKPDFTRMTGGFNFGGPLRIGNFLRRNSPTFFVGYTRTQNRNATTVSGRMPTALERLGDFSQTRIQTIDPSTGALIETPVRIFDPVSGQLFNNGVIPDTLISPQARALLQLHPLPNFSGGARYNYQVPLVDTTHTDSLQTRLNKSFNTKHALNGTFEIQSTRSDAPNLFQFSDTSRSKSINSAVSWTYRKSPRSTSTFRYQFSRQTSRSQPYFADKINVSGLAGISGNNQDASYWGPPNLQFSSGFSGLVDGRYSFNRTQNHTLGYAGFWNHNRHNFSWGADVRKTLLNTLSQDDARGTFTFTGEVTRSGDPATGYDLADFLLGSPATSSIAFGNADKYFRQLFYAGFMSDDWRYNGKLTLSLGVRWEYEAPITEVRNRLVNLDIAPNFAAVSPVVATGRTGSLTGTSYPESLVNPDKFGIQPRVAFAWRPVEGSSFIVRGGYGIYRNTNVYQAIANQMAQQSPLSKSLSVSRSAANPLTLANGFATVAGVTPNTFAVDPHFKVGFAQTWQLSIQRDLPSGMQMTALYLGTKGSRLPQEFLPNIFPDGAVSPSGYVYLASTGSSNRQAGQIQLRRRLRNGFTTTVQYTYAKAIDDAPLMAGGQVVSANQGGTSIAQDWLNLKAERGRSNFDQRHQLIVQAQYTSGVGGRGGALLSGWRNTLLKDWTFAPQLTIGSGLPQTPTYIASLPGTGFTGTLRPDVTGASLDAAPQGLFLNPAAYRKPLNGEFGNAGRNTITGPSQFSLNASLTRTFQMGERWNMDLQMTANNVLNHVSYASWVTNIDSAQFGLPSRANNMRTVQTTLRLRF